MIRTLFCILSCLCFYSCIDCGPQRELFVDIRFSADSLQIDSVAALNAISQDAFKTAPELLKGRFPSCQLPISLNADSTTFLFFTKEKTDTLTLFYKREFEIKNGCGFTVNADKPTHGTNVSATFSKVQVAYGGYILWGKQPVFHSSAPGISIDIVP